MQCKLKHHQQSRPERQARLEHLGIDWNYQRQSEAQRWNRYFNQLVAFHQSHGHFEIPNQSPYCGLWHWLTTQRHLQQGGQLPADRRQRIEALGFIWVNPLAPHEQAWDRQFTRLMEFQQTHGHFRVTEQMPEHSGLYPWIRMQRTLQRMQRLRLDRQQRLEAVGFPWDSARWRERTEKRWQGFREPVLK